MWGPNKFNAFTTYWEAGDRAAWESVVTPDVTFYVGGNSYSNTSGTARVWGFRGFLPNAPDGQLLWTNTFDSYLWDAADPYTLHVRMATFLRYPASSALYPGFIVSANETYPAGSLYQLVRCHFVFVGERMRRVSRRRHGYATVHRVHSVYSCVCVCVCVCVAQGRWTCKFEPKTGKIQSMVQEVVWALWQGTYSTGTRLSPAPRAVVDRQKEQQVRASVPARVACCSPGNI